MSSQPIVQWNYIIYFHIRGSFLNKFLHQFLEKSAQCEKKKKCKFTRFACFDRWLRRYDHITLLLKEYILFIGCLNYLSVHFHSCCFFIQYHGGIRELTFIPVWTYRFILCSILLTR